MLANVGLPAFFPHSLATLLGILVIAAIEGWFIMRQLDITFLGAYEHALVANWKSAIVGIPVAWLFWLGGLLPVTAGLEAMNIHLHPMLQSMVLQSVLFGGILPDEWSNVGSAAAWLLLLIPFWFGSVWIERRAIIKRLPGADAVQVSRAVVRGNLCTYTLFMIVGIAGLSSAIQDLPNRKTRFEEIRSRRLQGAVPATIELCRVNEPKRVACNTCDLGIRPGGTDRQ